MTSIYNGNYIDGEDIGEMTVVVMMMMMMVMMMMMMMMRGWKMKMMVILG